MKRENIRIISLFIIAILLLLNIYLYDDYKNRALDVDRKVDYIFNTYTYDTVSNEGKKLFFDAINVMNPDNLDYELNLDGTKKTYEINGQEGYFKINDINEVTHIFRTEDLNKYFQDKNIIKKDDTYYIEPYTNTSHNNYIGSKITFLNYDDTYAYFYSLNYYCDNTDYIGNIIEEPSCDYQVKETSFKLSFESYALRLSTYEDIKQVWQ